MFNQYFYEALSELDTIDEKYVKKEYDIVELTKSGDQVNLAFLYNHRYGTKQRAADHEVSGSSFTNFLDKAADDHKYIITAKPGIYAFLNADTLEVLYVGQAINLHRRLDEHLAAAYNPAHPEYNYRLYRAIRKYGPQHFIFKILEVLDSVDRQALDELEQKYIDEYHVYSDSTKYNLTSGGQGGAVGRANKFRPGVDADEATLKEIRDFLKNAAENNLLITEDDVLNRFASTGLKKHTLRKINFGQHPYFSKEYNGQDIDHPKKIYDFALWLADPDADTVDVIGLIPVDLVKDVYTVDDVRTDESGIKLLFTSERKVAQYITDKYGIPHISGGTIDFLLKGARKNDDLKDVGRPVLISIPKADIVKIKYNQDKLLN